MNLSKPPSGYLHVRSEYLTYAGPMLRFRHLRIVRVLTPKYSAA